MGSFQPAAVNWFGSWIHDPACCIEISGLEKLKQSLYNCCYVHKVLQFYKIAHVDPRYVCFVLDYVKHIDCENTHNFTKPKIASHSYLK